MEKIQTVVDLCSFWVYQPNLHEFSSNLVYLFSREKRTEMRHKIGSFDVCGRLCEAEIRFEVGMGGGGVIDKEKEVRGRKPSRGCVKKSFF